MSPLNPIFLWITAVLICSHVRPVNPDAFASVAVLRRLVDSEEALVQQIDGYILAETRRIQRIKTHLREIRNQTDALRSASACDSTTLDKAGHPLSAITLLKQWNQLDHLISYQASGFADLLGFASKLGVEIPADEDYAGALHGMLRLQRTYGLAVSDLARGVILGHKASKPLEFEDMYHLGKEALSEDRGLAREWFEEALRLLDNQSDLETQPRDHVYEINPPSAHITDTFVRLARIYSHVNQLEDAIRLGTTALEFDPSNHVLDEEIRTWKDRVSRNDSRSTQAVRRKRNTSTAYEKLCNGENVQNLITVNPALVCRYKSGFVPYVRYKEEIHSFSPRISFFVDVISDVEAGTMKQLAYNKLNRAQVGGTRSHTSDERTAKLAWLWDDNQFIRKLSQRVSDITGLSTTYHRRLSHAESFQVVNYGIGGQYDPHLDVFDEKSVLTSNSHPAFVVGSGDRVVTFMFYLSDVTAGGATVFPDIGVRIPARKNGAAFWYNLKLSGDVDRRTNHAGCPVLLGQKWVGNKWIREVPQLFRLPCGLERETPHPL